MYQFLYNMMVVNFMVTAAVIHIHQYTFMMYIHNYLLTMGTSSCFQTYM